MYPPDPRSPAEVPPEPGCADLVVTGLDVSGGLDSDGDGEPDSIFTEDEEDLLLHTDLDGDGRADQTVRLRPDGGTALELHDDPPSPVEVLLRWLRIR